MRVPIAVMVIRSCTAGTGRLYMAGMEASTVGKGRMAGTGAGPRGTSLKSVGCLYFGHRKMGTGHLAI